jgi:hypothetical protein
VRNHQVPAAFHHIGNVTTRLFDGIPLIRDSFLLLAEYQRITAYGNYGGFTFLIHKILLVVMGFEYQ